jgi:hypothetical protein
LDAVPIVSPFYERWLTNEQRRNHGTEFTLDRAPLVPRPEIPAHPTPAVEVLSLDFETLQQTERERAANCSAAPVLITPAP